MEVPKLRESVGSEEMGRDGRRANPKVEARNQWYYLNLRDRSSELRGMMKYTCKKQMKLYRQDSVVLGFFGGSLSPLTPNKQDLL